MPVRRRMTIVFALRRKRHCNEEGSRQLKPQQENFATPASPTRKGLACGQSFVTAKRATSKAEGGKL